MLIGTGLRAATLRYLAATIAPVDPITWLFILNAENSGRNYVTAYGDTQLDGDGSCVFDGSGDYAYTSDSEDWTVGNGPYRWEMYLKTSQGTGYFAGQSNSSGNNDTQSFHLLQSGGVIYFRIAVGVNFYTVQGGSGINDGNWHHLRALVDSSKIMRLYIDGTQVGTPVDLTGLTINNSTDIWAIGACGDYSGNRFSGSLSRVLITKGDTVSTDNFTPPVRTDAITVDSNTVFAPSFTGPAGSTTIIDLATPDDTATTPSVKDSATDSYAHAVQATAAYRPVYAYNAGLPYLDFAAGGRNFTSAFTQTNGLFTFVVSWDGTAAKQPIIFDDAAEDGISISATGGITLSKAGESDVTIAGVLTADTPAVVSVNYTDTHREVWKNGVRVSNVEDTTYHPVIAGAYVGRNQAGSLYLTSKLYLLEAAASPSYAQIAADHATLKATYGIS